MIVKRIVFGNVAWILFWIALAKACNGLHTIKFGNLLFYCIAGSILFFCFVAKPWKLDPEDRKHFLLNIYLPFGFETTGVMTLFAVYITVHKLGALTWLN